MPILEMLLDAGADPNRPSGGQTPFEIACGNDSPAAMRMLVARGANKHVVDDGSAIWQLPIGVPGRQAMHELRRMCLADAGTLCGATHGRLGVDSPASLLRGFPGIAAFIVDHTVPGDGCRSPIQLP
jgi:hypothetical protein